MDVNSLPLSKIIDTDQGAREHYHVPKYQREYTWRKGHLGKLLQDIDENDLGYFMGSIICVNDKSVNTPGKEIIYEVIDGQQRLTTLSLLMMAIYMKLKDLEDEVDEDDEEELEDYRSTLSSFRNKLLKRKKEEDCMQNETAGFSDNKKICFLRVQPSSQNNNLDDYKYILSEIGLLKSSPKPSYCGNRLIYKAFKFFIDETPNDLEGLKTIVAKINQLTFVHITVDSQANAFILFETLNNRGVPLSAIDIIKNKMLAEMERQHETHIDDSYEEWQEIIKCIPDVADQERFLRHYYNAYKVLDEVKVSSVSRAIKSKIIIIYETLIKKDAKLIFTELKEKSKIYSQFIDPFDNVDDAELSNALVELTRIGAAPSYQLLLYLFSLNSDSLEEDNFLVKVVNLLCKYYVRRNITDYPNTRDLDQINIDIIEKCHAQIENKQKLSFSFLKNELLTGKGEPASIQEFNTDLKDSIYYNNSLMTRYVLIWINRLAHTREYKPDLWARDDKGRFVWTIEHVLPQVENIPKEWVEMIADGDSDKAERIHEDHVHCLGNLTLSGYNSSLSTKGFAKKQKKQENRKILGHKINIGYKNGLHLNKLEFNYKGNNVSLANVPEWKEGCITSRNEVMTNLAIELFKFDNE